MNAGNSYSVPCKSAVFYDLRFHNYYSLSWIVSKRSLFCNSNPRHFKRKGNFVKTILIDSIMQWIFVDVSSNGINALMVQILVTQQGNGGSGIVLAAEKRFPFAPFQWTVSLLSLSLSLSLFLSIFLFFSIPLFLYSFTPLFLCSSIPLCSFIQFSPVSYLYSSYIDWPRIFGEHFFNSPLFTHSGWEERKDNNNN